MSLWSVFFSEVLGTAVLIALGVGVVANVVLPKSGGFQGGPLMINFGWGLGVFAGVYAAYKSGAHLNPAVTIGLLVDDPGGTYAKGVDISVSSTLVYFAAEFLGAFLGAVAAWAAYKGQFDEREMEVPTRGIFCTGPTVRNYAWNLVTEVIATFVLVLFVLVAGKTPTQIGPLGAALVVVGIGASLGGPTGYAINPARDLGPRIAHAVLPIKHKDVSDWAYSWVPVAGPVIGAVIAALVARAYI